MFIVSTYAEGEPPLSSRWFLRWIKDSVHDFRISKSLFKGMRYAVFGLGNSLYKENFNKVCCQSYCGLYSFGQVAKTLFEEIGQLSGNSYHPLGLGDENVAQSVHGGWLVTRLFLSRVKNVKVSKKISWHGRKGCFRA